MNKAKNEKKSAKKGECENCRVKYKLNFDILYDRKEVKNE